MARSHARLQIGMFSTDVDLRACAPHAKLLYVVLLQDPALNNAGVVVLREGMWAEDAGLTDEELEKALNELIERRFVVVDRRTAELLVRTFIRNDKVYEQPNVLKGALAQAAQILSPTLRRALAGELRRLPPKQADKPGKNGRLVVYPDPHACAELLDPSGPPENPSPNPSGNPSAKGSRNPVQNPPSGTLPGRDAGTPGGRGRGSSSSPVETYSALETTTSLDATSSRRDVDQICERLRDRMVGNGFRAPTITEDWRRQARLLLDKDERDLTQVLRLIDWCQADEFWHPNIKSVGKFRAQYDTLLARARQGQQRSTTSFRPGPRTADDKIADLQRLKTGTGGPPALYAIER